MKQIFVICEGQTEVLFIESVLQNTFSSEEVCFKAFLLGTPGHKGGHVTFERLIKNIRSSLRVPNCYVTTFFDFYGLDPQFPGKAKAEIASSSQERSRILLEAFQQKLDEEFGENNDIRQRIIPYVQMHEFEALLFSDPKALAESLDQRKLESKFEAVCQKFETPEEINDGPQTAPSKRISLIFPEYGKKTDGIEAAKRIGLEAIRKKCSLFNDRLTKLEILEDL